MIGSNPYAQMETEAPVKTTGKKKVRLSLFGVAFLIVFIIFLALLAVQLRVIEAMLRELQSMRKEGSSMHDEFNKHLTVDDEILRNPPSPSALDDRALCPPNIGPLTTCFHEPGFNCYCFVYFSRTWKQASRFCNVQKNEAGSIGSLVAIESKEEDEILTTIFKSEVQHDKISKHDVLWTSGTDKDNEGHWIWSSTGQPINPYTHWCPGEPNNNNATEHYLHKQLGNDGCWNDLPPTRMEKFICEIPIIY